MLVLSKSPLSKVEIIRRLSAIIFFELQITAKEGSDIMNSAITLW
jgi:hypothetical protein